MKKAVIVDMRENDILRELCELLVDFLRENNIEARITPEISGDDVSSCDVVIFPTERMFMFAEWVKKTFPEKKVILWTLLAPRSAADKGVVVIEKGSRDTMGKIIKEIST